MPEKALEQLEYDNVSDYMLKKYGLHTAVITGSVDGRTTAKLKNADMNTILTCFSPKSKDRDLFDSIPKVDIDVLIATDCISEEESQRQTAKTDFPQSRQEIRHGVKQH